LSVSVFQVPFFLWCASFCSISVVTLLAPRRVSRASWFVSFPLHVGSFVMIALVTSLAEQACAHSLAEQARAQSHRGAK
jgi:hypothetical protein